MRILLLAAACAGLAATPVMAQSGEPSRFYGAIGYGQLSGSAYDFDVATARLGARLNRYFGVEGEASLGLSEESFDVSIGGASGTIEHRYDAAAYAVGFLPLNDRLELFARVGYGTSEVKASDPSVVIRGDGESLNYGVGASYFLQGNNGVRADWTRRDLSDDGGDVDVWTLSFIRRF